MKIIIHLCCLTFFWSTCEGYPHLYHSDYPLTNDDHDCFYEFEYGLRDLARHLVPYCIRHGAINHSKRPCFGTEFTFRALRSNSIVSFDLFRWLAPIDVIDDYASYLLTTGTTNNESEQSYCNCSTSLSFGRYCQYRHIISDEERTLKGTIHRSLLMNLPDENDLYLMDERHSTTCYTAFNCTTYTGFCLDWRDIGDGFVHCIDGSDEANFVPMELNDCDAKTEYRCRNGLCIPRSFLLDRSLDCPDWYDEPQLSTEPGINAHQSCLSTRASAACEEHRIGLNFFSCGNGEHISVRFHGAVNCSSFRHAFMLKALFRPYYDLHDNNDVCHRMMFCLFEIICLFEHCPNGHQQHCAQLLNDAEHKNCPKTFFFPPGPFVFPFVRLLYQPRQVWDELIPDYICWNRSICDNYKEHSEITVDGFHCVLETEFRLHVLTLNMEDYLLKITQLILAIQVLFSQCDTSETHPTLYECDSRLSISPYRILDRRNHDCFPWLFLKEEEAETVENFQAACDLPDRFRCSDYACVSRILIRDAIVDCDSGSDELLFVGCNDEFDCQHLRELDLSQEPLIHYQEICDGHDIFELLYLIR